MIKAIAFDFVGVIGQEKLLVLNPLQNKIKSMFGFINESAAFLQHIADETGLSPQQVEQETRWIIQHLYSLREPALFEQLPALRFCLASNHLSYLLDWFGSLPIASYFEFFLNPSLAGAGKPHQVFFKKMIECFKLPAREILFVDDSLQNINAARALGLNGLHYQGDQLLSTTVNSWLKTQQNLD